MLGAQFMQALRNHPFPQIGGAADHQPRRLSPGVGIEYTNPMDRIVSTNFALICHLNGAVVFSLNRHSMFVKSYSEKKLGQKRNNAQNTGLKRNGMYTIS